MSRRRGLDPDARVGDDGVESGKDRQDLRVHRIDGSFVGDIRLDYGRFDVELGHQRLGTVAIRVVVDHHAGALLGECPCRRGTDAACGAGHQNDLPGQLGSHVVSRFSKAFARHRSRADRQVRISPPGLRGRPAGGASAGPVVSSLRIA